MKLIPLTQGQFALVDDDDYERLKVNKWHAAYCKNTKSYYARRKVFKERNVYKQEFMHYHILERKEGYVLDHKNRNPLDNRKENLRYATYSENSKNRSPKPNGSSKYLGVFKRKSNGTFTVTIRVNGKNLTIGSFIKETDAAMAYNNAALKHHGEFASINKIE